jgi:hypothetical protein
MTEVPMPEPVGCLRDKTAADAESVSPGTVECGDSTVVRTRLPERLTLDGTSG